MKRWLLPLFVGTVFLAAACGGGDSDGAGTSGTPAAKPGHITVKMLDNSFRPAQISVKAGTTVTFDLPNVGILPHNMHIASQRGVYRESPWTSEIVNGGKTTSLKWDVPAETGTYLFRCDVHEVEMVGKITVE